MEGIFCQVLASLTVGLFRKFFINIATRVKEENTPLIVIVPQGQHV